MEKPKENEMDLICKKHNTSLKFKIIYTPFLYISDDMKEEYEVETCEKCLNEAIVRDRYQQYISRQR